MKILIIIAVLLANQAQATAPEVRAAYARMRGHTPHEETTVSDFTQAFDAMAREVHQTARDVGWWDEPRGFSEFIALTHSELSEALEYSRGDDVSDKIWPHTGVEEELADVILRIMDYATAKGLLVSKAIEAKNEYNKTREHKHGKRF